MEDTDRSISAARELTALWTKAQPIVRSFIYSLTRDAHVAEDLLQDVAVTAVDKFAELESRERFVSWVLAIARYKVMNHRTAAHRDRHVFNAPILEGLAAAHERLAPLAEQRRAALAHCIEQLDERGRDAIERRYIENQPIPRIAEDLGINANTVYALLHRVRQNLLRCINDRVAESEGRP